MEILDLNKIPLLTGVHVTCRKIQTLVSIVLRLYDPFLYPRWSPLNPNCPERNLRTISVAFNVR